MNNEFHVNIVLIRPWKSQFVTNKGGCGDTVAPKGRRNLEAARTPAVWSGFELGGFGPDAERASASNAALDFGDKSHTAVVVVASLRRQSHLE